MPADSPAFTHPQGQAMNIDTLMGTPRPAATRRQIIGATAVCLAVAETIREAGSTPSGPIYAALMTRMGIDLQSFEAIIRTLVSTGLIEETPGSILKWTGPKMEAGQ